MKQKELTLLFLLKEDEILLAMKKRGFGKGKWNGIGGKVEDGESIEEALIRECQEEISVTPIDSKKVANLLFDEIHEHERKMMHVNVFTSRQWHGEPTESEEMKPRWFKQSQIPYDKCWSDDKYWLPQILLGRLIVASFIMSDTSQVLRHTINTVGGFNE